MLLFDSYESRSWFRKPIVRSLRRVNSPALSWYSPLIMRSNVDLPVPFAPINPIFSPGLMCHEVSWYRYLEPNSKLMLFNTNIIGFFRRSAKVVNAAFQYDRK